MSIENEVYFIIFTIVMFIGAAVKLITLENRISKLERELHVPPVTKEKS